MELQQYLRNPNYPSNATFANLFSTAGISVGAFLKSPHSQQPDIQLTFFPFGNEPHVTSSIKLNEERDDILITVALTTPEGKSRVKLTPRLDQVGSLRGALAAIRMA